MERRGETRFVHEARQLSDEELGAFLRREGVNASRVEPWREALHEAFGKRTPGSQQRPRKDARRIQLLERDLQRKKKALAESAALLWLRKRGSEIWGGEADDSPPRNGG